MDRLRTIASAHRQFDADRYEVGGFLPGAEIDDIVVADQRFVRWPLGAAETELQVGEMGTVPVSCRTARFDRQVASYLFRGQRSEADRGEIRLPEEE